MNKKEFHISMPLSIYRDGEKYLVGFLGIEGIAFHEPDNDIAEKFRFDIKSISWMRPEDEFGNDYPDVRLLLEALDAMDEVNAWLDQHVPDLFEQPDRQYEQDHD